MNFELVARTIRVVLQAIYGLVLAIFAYNPSVGVSGYSLPQVLNNMLSNPCNVNQGIFGLLFTDVGVLMAILLLIGVIGVLIFVYNIIKWGGHFVSVATHMVRMAVGSVTGRFSQAISVFGGRGTSQASAASAGYEHEGYEESASGNLLLNALKGFAILIIAAMLMGTVQQSGAIQGAIQVAGTVFSGIIVLPITIGLSLMNNLVSVSTGAQLVPLCTSAGAGIQIHGALYAGLDVLGLLL